jgi:hypothetical protein
VTTKTTGHTIASTLADMRAHIEDLARAHDALTLPETEDVTVDWRSVVEQVDALGEASHQLMLLARDTMIPTLIAVKTHAQTALAEIDSLDLALTQASRA